MIEFGTIDAPQFNYVNPVNPAVDTNPTVRFATWVNLNTGELFICTDNSPGLNIWVGQSGTTVS